MESIVNKHNEEVKLILRQNNVKRAYWFGSVVNGNFNEQSDIDLLIGLDESLDPITYGDKYFYILNALESLFGREVDLLTEKSLSNPVLIKRLQETRQVIYE